MPGLAPAPDDDHRLAHDLATRAGELLLELRAQAGESAYERWALRDEGDLGSHHFLVDALRDARPDDRVLSEEGPRTVAAWVPTGSGSSTRSTAPASSASPAGPTGPCTSPSSSTTDWRPGPSPSRRSGITYSTGSPPGARRLGPHGRRAPVRHQPSRPHPATLVAAEALGARLVPMGSAGAKAMAVVRGEAEVYAHAGGQYEWDSAAPAAVALAAGLHVSGVDGSTLQWNKPDPWQPHLLICRPGARRTGGLGGAGGGRGQRGS